MKEIKSLSQCVEGKKYSWDEIYAASDLFIKDNDRIVAIAENGKGQALLFAFSSCKKCNGKCLTLMRRYADEKM